MFVWEKVFLSGMALLFIFIHSSVFSAPESQQPKLDCPTAPVNCSDDYIGFYLYFSATENQSDNPIKLSSAKINKKTFQTILDSQKQNFDEMKVMLHGVNGSHSDEFNRFIRNAYYSSDRKLPILSVDYGKIIKQFECMSVAITSIPIIAKCTLEIMEKIVQYISCIKKIHAVAFSYGTHVAGEIANLMTKSKLLYNGFYRITGLEVPIYQFEFNWGFLHDKSAGIVDIIHTNGGVLGEIRAIGTIDFYFNGGYFQKNCEHEKDVHLCSHKKAYQYFAESILYENVQGGFVAHFKTSSDMSAMSFLGSRGTVINNPSVKFGEYLTGKYEKGVYHINTNEAVPYGLKENSLGLHLKNKLSAVFKMSPMN